MYIIQLVVMTATIEIIIIVIISFVFQIACFKKVLV